MCYQSLRICLILNFTSSILLLLLYFHTFPHTYDFMHQDCLLPILNKTNWTPLLNNGDGINTICNISTNVNETIDLLLSTASSVTRQDRITPQLPTDLHCSFFSRYPKGLQIGTWIDSHDTVICLNNAPTLRHQQMSAHVLMFALLINIPFLL
jgi:hypothetical protein